MTQSTEKLVQYLFSAYKDRYPNLFQDYSDSILKETTQKNEHSLALRLLKFKLTYHVFMDHFDELSSETQKEIMTKLEKIEL